MSISTQIAQLEAAGLIDLARARPEIEYLFRHALIQEAVYASLLKSERAALHHTVGEVLEELSAGRREELAARLAEHFWQAGEPRRALAYFVMAARRAARVYANAEAIEAYSRALAAMDHPAAVDRAAMTGQPPVPEQPRVAGQPPVAEQPAVNQPAAVDLPAIEQPPVTGQPAADRAAIDQPPVTDQPAVNQPGEKQPAAPPAADLPSRAEILRARGALFDVTGDFPHARADLEAALRLAGEAGDPRGEWEALTGLGELWAARDYRETDRYYQQALQRAREQGDDRLLAYSLNRLGNYLINADRPDESNEHHQEALAIFERLEDEPGIAETLDFLGMSRSLGGSPMQSEVYLRQSAQRFEKLGDRRSYVSSLVTHGIQTANMLTETALAARLTVAEGVGQIEQAYQVAGEIGWRPGQVYCLICLGMLLAAQGEYGRAPQVIRQAYETAQEIQHRQWVISSLVALGALHLDLFELERAVYSLNEALEMARQSRSLHWTRTALGLLGSALAAQGDLARAGELFARRLPADTPAQSLGQRQAWAGRAALALAQGDPRLALEIADRLLSAGPPVPAGRAILRVGMLRGEALTALLAQAGPGEEKQRLGQQAAAALTGALAESQALGSHARTWRMQALLARLAAHLGQPAESARQREAARALLLALAGKISDEPLRQRFTARAMEEIEK